jgi:hypothetical protein
VRRTAIIVAILLLAASCSSSDDGASDETTTTTAAGESSESGVAAETTTTTAVTTTSTSTTAAEPEPVAAGGECVVGTWEQRSQEFIEAIAETFVPEDDPLLADATILFVEGSYQIEMGADGSMVSVRDNWTMEFSSPEGGLRTTLDGEETGTYAVDGDVLSISLEDSTVEVSQAFVLDGTVTPAPAGFTQSVSVEGLDGSGTFTCDDEVLAVQVEGGVPATFDRIG